MTPYRYMESGSPIRRQLRFRAFLGCQEIMELLAPGAVMLDIGGGDGLHARYFRSRGLQVDVVDMQEGMERLAFEGPYERFQPTKAYDAIWCSHVYEHIMNPGIFMAKILADLKPGGFAAITVPPMKPDMLFEHVTLWNPGLLLIHMIKSGFDCRHARVGCYHYNITVIAQRPGQPLSLPDKELLPAVEWRGAYFNGDIKFLNWTHQGLEIAPAFDLRAAPVEQLLGALSKCDKAPTFAMSRMPGADKPSYMYVDADMRIVCPVG